MRNSGKALRRQQADFALLQGGTLPEHVVRRHFTSLKKTQTEEIEKKLAIRQQAAKYFGQIRPSGAAEEREPTQRVAGAVSRRK